MPPRQNRCKWKTLPTMAILTAWHGTRLGLAEKQENYVARAHSAAGTDRLELDPARLRPGAGQNGPCGMFACRSITCFDNMRVAMVSGCIVPGERDARRICGGCTINEVDFAAGVRLSAVI